MHLQCVWLKVIFMYFHVFHVHMVIQHEPNRSHSVGTEELRRTRTTSEIKQRRICFELRTVTVFETKAEEKRMQ